MRTKRNCTKWLAGALLLLPLFVLTLTAQQSTSLVISGQTGAAKVIQVDGRNYVEVEGLARLTGGQIGFSGTQIVLTVPGLSGGEGATPAPPTGFSKEFLAAAIEAMSQAREWHATLKNAIERGYPLSEDWIGGYRRQCQQSMRLAVVAATTDTDKNLAPLLTNVVKNMNALSDKYLQMTKNMNYIDPNSLQSDPIDQRLVACGRSLASMAGNNQFVDDGSCH